MELIITLFDKGGPVMWPLLACSIVAATVAFERVIFYVREAWSARRQARRVEEALALAARGEFDDAERVAESAHCRAGRLALAAIARGDLEGAALDELDRLRRGLTVLDTIITLAPMLGILGTVTGIIGSFDMLSSDGIQNPAGVTRGISEALVTTAAGLVVSMLALVPFNAFGSHIRRVARELEQHAHLAETACAKGLRK